MINFVHGMGALTGGMVCGALFFGGLWITINGCFSAPLSSRFLAGSFFLRLLITLFPIILLCRESGVALGLSLLGFLGARQFFIRSVSFSLEVSSKGKKASSEGETNGI